MAGGCFVAQKETVTRSKNTSYIAVCHMLKTTETPKKQQNPIDIISINLQSGGDSQATTVSKFLLAHVAERERRRILYDSPEGTTVRIVSARGGTKRRWANHKCPNPSPRVSHQGCESCGLVLEGLFKQTGVMDQQWNIYRHMTCATTMFKL